MAVTLSDVILDLPLLERSSIASITIKTAGARGYEATISIDLRLPLGLTLDLPQGVTVSGFERYPDIKRSLDWKEPIWEQIKALINHRELSQPAELGTMEAAELSQGAAESDKAWRIVTHGAPRSEERKRFILRDRNAGAAAEPAAAQE